MAAIETAEICGPGLRALMDIGGELSAFGEGNIRSPTMAGPASVGCVRWERAPPSRVFKALLAMLTNNAISLTGLGFGVLLTNNVSESLNPA